MSMERCWSCSDPVDTDDDPDCYVTVGRDDRGRPDERCYCELCREENFVWCDKGEHWVEPEDMYNDSEWCANCTEIAADALHDAQTGDR